MERPEPRVFPFAEFDPVLRRDLCGVLEAAQQRLGLIDAGHSVNEDEAARADRVKARLIAHLRATAEAGERCPDRLLEGALRAAAAETPA